MHINLTIQQVVADRVITLEVVECEVECLDEIGDSINEVIYELNRGLEIDPSDHAEPDVDVRIN